MKDEPKKSTINKLEVLAPAGSRESFFAALNSGADAIYLGLSDFNARMKAENFNTQNIREIVKIAHTFGVKIYITINTLLNSNEFEKLIEMVEKLVEAKVDAFIVQDFGVAYVLKKCFSNITLHASTQMGIHNLYGAKVAEKLGFSRVILSRETKLEDIKEIHEKTNLEIEYFVQGALCIAFSGNCYLSALEKEQSGNSGKCLQLCRLPYGSNKTTEKKYLLSAKDLCLLERLKDLADAGVSSFKIEGRMRHAGYVATATSIYKQATTQLSETGSISSNFIESKTKELQVSFSRGSFNKKAYLDCGTPDQIVGKDYQNHIGLKIGITTKVSPFKNDLFKIEISSKTPIHFGDGLKFIDETKKEQVASIGAGNVQKISENTYVIVSKTKIQPNLSVFLTQDAENEQKLLKNQRKIKINLKIIANYGKNLEIYASNGAIETTFVSDYVLEKAKNKPLTADDFKSQFSKLNDTFFGLENIKVETNGIFLPKSMLNDARRQIVEKLENATIEFYEKDILAKKSNDIKSIKPSTSLISKNIILFNKTSQISTIDDDTLYVYCPSIYNKSDIIETQKKFGKNFALSLPTVLCHEDKQVLNDILSSLEIGTNLFANNIYFLNFLSKGFKILVSPLLNVKNVYSVLCLESLGVKTICASVEADIDFANDFDLTYLCEGAFPVMTFMHCPYKTIYENTCKSCKFDDNLKLFADFNKTYEIKRIKLNNCQFQLISKLNRNKAKFNMKNLSQ
jgi:putative protease